MSFHYMKENTLRISVILISYVLSGWWPTSLNPVCRALILLLHLRDGVSSYCIVICSLCTEEDGECVQLWPPRWNILARSTYIHLWLNIFGGDGIVFTFRSSLHPVCHMRNGCCSQALLVLRERFIFLFFVGGTFGVEDVGRWYKCKLYFSSLQFVSFRLRIVRAPTLGWLQFHPPFGINHYSTYEKSTRQVHEEKVITFLRPNGRIHMTSFAKPPPLANGKYIINYSDDCARSDFLETAKKTKKSKSWRGLLLLFILGIMQRKGWLSWLREDFLPGRVKLALVGHILGSISIPPRSFSRQEKHKDCSVSVCSDVGIQGVSN